eukprot:TRINITY_DN1298_c0_g2_i7.p1 TRINITY_DN1298_c0_g2~~TRINITY_DN1298_c0_g2_i7.p1  ORF type:complete len:253 (-),score=43.21 TRINITY_DN1298_c0_g2_i7:865-1623(-)
MAGSTSSASDFKEKDRFDGTNYTVWSLRMSALLKSKELWDVVSGMLAKPANLAADPAVTTIWMKAKNQAVHVILGGISSDWMENITQNLTALELWEELTHQYSNLNMLSQVAADFKLRSLRMRDGDTAEKHVGLFRAARIRLHASGDVISDFKAIGIFLSSLPPGNCRWCGLPNHWERDCRKKAAGEPRKVAAATSNVVVKKSGQFVVMGNDSGCAIRGIGEVPVVMADGSQEVLENVLYVPLSIRYSGCIG